MYAFFRAHWLLILALATLLAWQVLFPIWSKAITKQPLDVPIALSPKGSVDTAVRVLIPEVYELNLVFERAGHQYEELTALLGTWGYRDGKPIPSGVRVPMRWSLANSSTGAVVAAGEIDSFGSSAWSAANVYRKLAGISVPPGNYKFNAQVLRDVPELAQIKSRLAMKLRPTASSTWQTSLVWWGSLASFLLVWPAIAVLSLLLLWRAGLTLRSSVLPSAAAELKH
jgi:hypothetical protein